MSNPQIEMFMLKDHELSNVSVYHSDLYLICTVVLKIKLDETELHVTCNHP